MKSKRVLIVDDNDLNRKLFENLIGQVCLFESAKNGIEALALLEENRFDLILMDIQMPELDGLSATKIIRSEQQYKNLPIIGLSANAMEEDIEKAMAVGMNDYVVKPIEPDALFKSILSVV